MTKGRKTTFDERVEIVDNFRRVCSSSCEKIFSPFCTTIHRRSLG